MPNKHSALLIIDVQQGFDHPSWGPRNNPDAEANVGRLLKKWRDAGWPVYHVKHNSRQAASTLRPGQPGNDIKPALLPLPGEPLIGKDVNSAFIGTDLEHQLRAAGIDSVVIVGLTTNHCVSTTARMAGNLDFTTFVVDDATAAFDRIGPDGTHYDAATVHRLSLANLHGEFATIVNTDDLLD